MTKYERTLLIPGIPIEEVFNVCLKFFTDIGYTLKKYSEPTFIEFQREGSSWRATHEFEYPHVLTIYLSLSGNKRVNLTLHYHWDAIGKPSKNGRERAEKIIRSLLTSIYSRKEVHNERKRICPKCKREIPWDAKICPYCGYDFSEVKKDKKENKQPLIVQEETKKNVKVCPNCGKDVPVDALFCPYCGYKFLLNENSEFSTKYYPKQNFSGRNKRKGRINNDLLAKKYARYGVIWSIVGFIFFGLFGLLGIYYGFKARKLNTHKGLGGIILGIVDLILFPVDLWFLTVII